MKILSALLVVLLFISTAEARNAYYPTEYQRSLPNMKNEALKEALFSLMVKQHIYKAGRNDTLVDHCGQQKNNGRCYGHKSIGYRGARKVLFGKIHLEEDSRGYFVKDVYCRKEFTNNETNIGPNTIPNSNMLNCEHTWPQSKFSGRFPKDKQKSDLHHLYPTDSRANSVRGNYEFADVIGNNAYGNCEPSYIGNAKSSRYFEPPTEHKGNVARAIFYFAMRYQMKISSTQEAYMREWHEADPVDAEELKRNDTVQMVQGNRNPFIDYPELISKISDF